MLVKCKCARFSYRETKNECRRRKFLGIKFKREGIKFKKKEDYFIHSKYTLEGAIYSVTVYKHSTYKLG